MGRLFTDTLLGSLLSKSCIPLNEMTQPEYFDNPSKSERPIVFYIGIWQGAALGTAVIDFSSYPSSLLLNQRNCSLAE